MKTLAILPSLASLSLLATPAPAAPQTARFQGPGASGHVYSLGVYQGSLIAAGEFTSIGGVAASRIARWDGLAWSALGSTVLNGVSGPRFARVFDTVEHGGKLYVGGAFLKAGGVTVRNIASWNGATQTWSALGGGMDGWVLALAVYDDGTGPALYAGGDFEHAGGVAVGHVARWNESTQTWSPVGAGMDGPVNALLAASFEGADRLFVGGDFGQAGGLQARNVARLTGSTWSRLASGMSDGVDGAVLSLAVFDDGDGPALYAGGDFTHAAANTAAARIAYWRNGSWSPLGTGVGNDTAYEDVRVMVTFDVGDGPVLVVGGQFTRAGAVAIAPATPLVPPVDSHNDTSLGAGNTLVGAWDGTGWTGVGQNMNDTVFDMVAVGSQLYAAGRFTSADGATSGRIARFDTALGSWVELGTGLGTSHAVRALVAFDDGLFAGGDFVSAGSAAISRVARWSESPAGWSPLGSGVNGSVRALAPSATLLYAGGTFTSAGGAPASRVAAWNPSSATWSALGAGVNDTVHALALHDDGGGAQLYAGGELTKAGSAEVGHVARWDGAAWAALPGGGLDAPVRALVSFQGDLIAGGEFGAAGTAAASGIARWDGALWTNMGAGLDGDVLALCVAGGDLFAGGTFASSGSTAVAHLARWNGTGWVAVGGGLDGPVAALASDDVLGVVYAGGRFATAGGVPAANLAAWNGVAWSAVGGGTDDWVRALRRFGTRLYAGGGFGVAAGASSMHIVGFPVP